MPKSCATGCWPRPACWTRRCSVPPVPIEDDATGQVVVKGDLPRRSIYLQVQRTKPVSFLTAFDAPVMETNCDRRLSSTVATQSLMMMNSEVVSEALRGAGRTAGARNTARLSGPRQLELSGRHRPVAIRRRPLRPVDWPRGRFPAAAVVGGLGLERHRPNGRSSPGLRFAHALRRPAMRQPTCRDPPLDSSGRRNAFDRRAAESSGGRRRRRRSPHRFQPRRIGSASGARTNRPLPPRPGPSR